jgi:hypothetical protein
MRTKQNQKHSQNNMEKDEDLYTALLVIDLGGTFSNAYGLCRTIDRKFSLYNCSDIIKRLIQNNFVEYININGVKQFLVNTKGADVIAQHKPSLLEKLRHNFSSEIEFINQL